MNQQQAKNVKPNQILYKVECLKVITQKVYYQSSEKEKDQGIQFFIDAGNNSGFRQLVTIQNLPKLHLTKKEAIKELKKEIKEDIQYQEKELKWEIEDCNKSQKKIKRLKKKLTNLK